MRIISFTLFLILVILGVGFAMQNAEHVTLNYYFGTISLPLSLLLVLFLAVGALLGLFTGWCLLLRSQWQNWRVRKQISKTVQQNGSA